MPTKKRSPKKPALTQVEEISKLEAKIKEARTARATLQAERARILKRAQFAEQLHEEMRYLIRLAKSGDKGAFLSLLQLAFAAVSGIEEVHALQADIVQSMARDLHVWPGFISHKRSISNENKKYADELRLGKGGVLSESEWQPFASSTQLAFRVFVAARILASQGLLPPLVPNTKKVWFETSWKFQLRQGFQPENDEVFSKLAKSAATKKPKWCKTLHPATRVANMRAQIKRRGWEAFDALVVAQ